MMVELRDTTMKYETMEGEIEALGGLSLSVDRGEFVSLVGPSGCGKSTLLSLVAGLLFPTGGEVLIEGRPVQGPSAQVGYMLQHDYLLAWRTVLSNVLLGLEIRGSTGPPERKRAVALLERYGLGAFRDSYPHQLSGGMRQRVALARTLVLDPDILLLDEPFSALDYQTRLRLQDEVGRILRDEGKTVLLVTHDITEAISMSDRVVILTRRPATVKRELVIPFRSRGLTPLATREEPDFRRYFNEIWRELDVQVEV